MNNMKCQSQNHYEKEINTICMDTNCKDQRFCCLICLNDLHMSHAKKWVEVNQINEFVEKEKNKEITYPDTCNYGQKQMIQGLEQLSNLIDSLQKIILEKIEMIKQQNLKDYLKNTCKAQQGIQDWNKFLEGILQFVEIDNCLIKLTTSEEGQVNKKDEEEIKIIKQSQESVQNIINQFNKSKIEISNPPQLKIARLCFKEDRKNKDIAIIDECTIKKTINQYTNAMAFANEGFDPSTQSYAFSFNIQNIARWVFVGVGNDEGIKVAQYCFNNYGSLGHGQYMLSSSSNYTYHHSDGEFNDKQKGMPIKTGDKIQIKYDHSTKVLEFRQSSDQNAVVRMSITDMTKMLYPCALLNYAGDQVQLVEY